MALTRGRRSDFSVRRNFAPGSNRSSATVLTRAAARRREGSPTTSSEMRRAIALEKGEGDVWDLKYAAGGMVDIDFHRAIPPALFTSADKAGTFLDVSTLHVLDKGGAARGAARKQQWKSCARRRGSITTSRKILRLCVTERFKPKTAGEDLLRIMARAGDAPGFFLARGAGQGDANRKCGGCFASLLEGGN